MQKELPTYDTAAAYHVTQRLIDFVHRFDTRTTDSGSLARILTGETFKGGIVGQAPEFFTEQYLIVPVLNGLGFNQVRWRPVDLTKEERKEPDFQIDDPPSEIVCIVEAKRLGREKADASASKQIEGYLSDDTFVKYATDRDRRFLVGIATDGVFWTLYAKPIGQREIIDIGTISIQDELLALTQSHRRATQSSSELVLSTRNSLESSLIPLFANHNLREVVVDEINNRY